MASTQTSPSEETGTETKAELSPRILNRKALYPSIRDPPKEKKGRLQFIGRKTLILTKTDAILTHAAGGNIQSPLARDIVT